LKGDGQSKAMFEDPDGQTHILSQGDIIGRERGTVSKVLDQGVIVTEKTFNYLGVESLYEKVISLPEK
jgi:Tfp pilus assembly protein PilP